MAYLKNKTENLLTAAEFIRKKTINTEVGETININNSGSASALDVQLQGHSPSSSIQYSTMELSLHVRMGRNGDMRPTLHFLQYFKQA